MMIDSNLTQPKDCAAREHSTTICAREAEKSERRAKAWRFLEKALIELKPGSDIEGAVWDMLCSMRHGERY
jgi:hypothetical protein